jgi:hypothetical protein
VLYLTLVDEDLDLDLEIIEEQEEIESITPAFYAPRYRVDRADMDDIGVKALLHDDGKLLIHPDLQGIDPPSAVITQLKGNQRQLSSNYFSRSSKASTSVHGRKRI